MPHGHDQKRSTDRLKSRQLLHHLIYQHLDAGELRGLCFDVGLNFDDLGGEGHSDHVRELVLTCVRRSDMGARLLTRLRELRPEVDWPELEQEG